MTETQKAFNRRQEEGWFDVYLRLPGIDIGCGKDLVRDDFQKWDLIYGDSDAQLMEGVPDGSFQTVYCSHVLEHLNDPVEAIRNWYRILAEGGHLIIVVPHRDLYEKKTALPSQWSVEHKSFWLPHFREDPDTWGLEETLKLVLPPTGWELVVLRTLDTQYNANKNKHPLGEYSIEIMVKKVISDRPIYKALVTELLSKFEGVQFGTMHFWIEKHLQEAGLPVLNPVAGDPPLEDNECIVIWGSTREQLQGSRTKRVRTDWLHPPRYIVLDCEDQRNTDWGTRLLYRSGYEGHPEMMKRVAELGWGCKVLERVREPITDLVTVVVPTYNSEQYIEECLQSILNQSHEALEVILVDDASEDDTVQIASKLLGGGIRWHSIIQLRHRIPAGAVRQKGVDEAVGDFICCFDSDDVMPSKYLKTALEAFSDTVDFVYPRQWWLIPEDEWGKGWDFPYSYWGDHDVAWRGIIGRGGNAFLLQNTSDYAAGSKLGSCMIMPTVCRYSTPQRFDPELLRLQDWDMHLDLFSRGATGEGFFCAPYIRNRSSSITNSSGRETFEQSRDRIALKHSLPTPPKLLILPLNSHGALEHTLAGPRIRGRALAPHIPASEEGDLNTLRYQWRRFDAFYFVCAPTPQTVGWATFLKNHGKKVLFDVCVEYWSPDYLFEGFTTSDFWDSFVDLWNYEITLIFATQTLADSFNNNLAPGSTSKCEAHILRDSVMPSLNIKQDYSRTGLLSWCGAPGNMTELLAYTPELVRLTEELNVTVRLITEEVSLRIPFRWEWTPWSVEDEDRLITETDIYLRPQLDYGSFATKAVGKYAKACSLGMPVIDVGSLGWEDRLRQYMSSEDLRRERGRGKLQLALTEFITPLVAQELIRILNS